MYTGEIDQISNKATWISETYEIYDDSDGTTTDLTTATEIEVFIKDQSGCNVLTGTLESGKVFVPGPGFYWRFEDTDLSVLCAGTYGCGVKITINGATIDEIIGTIAVIEGN
jgi:hypothetical protein